MLIDSAETLAEAVASLARLDDVMARLVAGGAYPPLRKRDPGFPALVGIVVSQQLSTASAAAILGRLQDAMAPFRPESIASASDAALAAAGLSRPKIRTLRAIAAAALSGALPLADLHRLPGDEAHAHLTAVSGIGPWTADIYLLFCLGHPDVMPAGDLALQEAARMALGLAERPGPKALAALADRWRPWRGAAALVLWAYYGQVKARDGAPTAG